MDMPEAISEKGGGVRMKRGWKIFWIVCAVCMVVGFVCCAASFALGVTVEAVERRFPNGIGFIAKSGDRVESYDDDNDYEEYDEDAVNYNKHHEDEHHDETAYDTEEPGNIIEGSKRLSFKDVGGLDVDVWAGEIDVRTDPSLSDGIIIDTDNVSEKLCLRCYMDGTELKVVSKKRVLRINDGKAGKITIRVPSGVHFNEASLGLSSGYLHVEDISANELSVDVGAGEGAVDSFTAQEADLNCGAGTLVAMGAVEAEVDIECGVGEVTYTAVGKEADYNYDIDCGIGQIVCGQSTYTGLGKNKTIDHHGSKEMNIECGIGTVTVNFSE